MTITYIYSTGGLNPIIKIMNKQYMFITYIHSTGYLNPITKVLNEVVIYVNTCVQRTRYTVLLL